MNFRQKVIQICKKIPHGKVTTYGTIATLAGVPRGGRIIGGILHHFSDQHNLPWQRVVNKEGYISTRCPEHVKQLQKALLKQEGIEVSKDFMIDLDKYGWFGS